MAERLIIVSAPHKFRDSIVDLHDHEGVVECHTYRTDEDEHDAVHLLVSADMRQELLDKLQDILSGNEDWRLIIMPVEASVPRPEEEDAGDKEEENEEKRKQAKAVESREELYEKVSKNAELSEIYLLFVGLSAVVAAIGLIENNVAVIVGAMVIAPLLGPNLAFCLGVALGDRELMFKAILTTAAGIGLVVVLGGVIGYFWPIDFDSEELMSRTEVGLDSMALALASGAAAALSMTTGVSSALVGVMVAVALMPPAVAIGLFLGADRAQDALGALLLLSVNVVCLNLAAQLSFVARGITPRTWMERKNARRAVFVNVIIWIALTVLLAVLLLIRKQTG
ncbi:TIGR00341 family protein [Qingshengfaniella alkalisoli]|uniref:TIGR00341 family protein n=1 Tax=Qingshengfaniella alkalisoli TaxID=2599296 RepID=A0A5B8ISL6_9RHOB|nr:TIGR00341 family protein [Qingshengfaniella alkalisoli]QDY68423.1 TIGR00341 family protein [Qingshengfaniella alkalisoli]